MRVTRSQWILVSAACLIVAASAAQTRADLPPGADANNWVPISDSAGILLTNVATMPEARRLELQRQGLNADSFVPLRDATGVLMVKRGNTWARVDLELPKARVQHLN